MMGELLGGILLILLFVFIMTVVSTVLDVLGRLGRLILFILICSVILVAPVVVVGFTTSTDWIDWVVCLCAVLGASVAAAVVGLLKAKNDYPPRQHYPEVSFQITRPPSCLPAAVAAMLIPGGRPQLASIVEMCQRGTLYIEAKGNSPSSYEYRFSVLDRRRYPWEQTFCEAVPQGYVEGHRLDEISGAMAEPLEERLQAEGIVSRVSRLPVWPRVVAWCGSFGITVVAAYYVTLFAQIEVVGLGFLLSICLFAYLLVIRPLATLVDRTVRNSLGWLMIGQFILWVALAPLLVYMLAAVSGHVWLLFLGFSIPVGVYYIWASSGADSIIKVRAYTVTDQGIREIANWRAFRDYLLTLRSHGDRHPPDSLLPYVVALTADNSWLDHWTGVPAWFRTRKRVDANKSNMHRREAYRVFMSAATKGKGANEGGYVVPGPIFHDDMAADGGFDVDIDVDF